MNPNLLAAPRRVAFAAATASLVALTLSVAAAPPPGERWSDMAFRGSSDWRSVPRPAANAAPVYPARSTVRVYHLPYYYTNPAKPEDPTVAHVVAHLPPGASLWVEGKQMVKEASKPSHDLVSPPLDKGWVYTYHAKVEWLEDGKWVTQAHAFPLRRGEVHCLEVVPLDAAAAEAEVAASLSKLPTPDRAAAEAQKFCAVQDAIRLGSMGPPVKVSVDGKDVFLCCEGCKTAAVKDPARTVKTAEANKEKAARAPAPK